MPGNRHPAAKAANYMECTSTNSRVGLGANTDHFNDDRPTSPFRPGRNREYDVLADIPSAHVIAIGGGSANQPARAA